VSPIGQETIVNLFARLPGPISVKINPPLDNATATADPKCDISHPAWNQRWYRCTVLITIAVGVVSQGICIRLAIRVRVGRIELVTQPRPGNHVVGTAA
jgi:hypothetical protein